MKLARLACALSMCFATLAASAQTMAPHPRLLLDSATLTGLRARVASSSFQWSLLRNYCNSFIGGTVNLPDGPAFPAAPNIGAGDNGRGYMSAVVSEGLCYQTLLTTDPTNAAKYGAKAHDVLIAMSTPFTGAGSHGADPCTESGAGIGYYGAGMGIGYDWVFPLLSTTERQQVYTTANAWLGSFTKPNGCSAAYYAHPQSDLFSAYFHADAAIALATYDENPKAPQRWNDWINKEYRTATTNPPHIGVQPYYAAHLAGGGWPGGMNAGHQGILNMGMAAIEAKTAAGLDIVNSPTAPFPYLLDMPYYLMHFTTPKSYMDDRDTVHADGYTTKLGTFIDTVMYRDVQGFLRYFNARHQGEFGGFLQNLRGLGGFRNPAPQPAADRAWEQFVFFPGYKRWGGSGDGKSTYFAPGLNEVSVGTNRGSFWMSFRAGPYVNNPAAGEEGFDQGSPAIFNGAWFLINGTGRIAQPPHGDEDEARVFTDNYGPFDGTVYSGNRTLSNIYYVRRMQGDRVLEPYGQGAYTAENPPHPIRTNLSREETKSYSYMLAPFLSDMYRRTRAGAVQEEDWAREIVVVGSTVLVYDRTTEGNSADDQFLAFHFPMRPVVCASPPAGGSCLDLDLSHSSTTGIARMTTLFPANATTTTLGVYPASDHKAGGDPLKVWQVQVRPAGTAVKQKWLNVFDRAFAFDAPATVTSIPVTSGHAVGALVAKTSSGTTTNSAVIFNTNVPWVPNSGAVAYNVPALATNHVVTELSKSTVYKVSVGVSGGQHFITISPTIAGTAGTTTANGVLSFNVAVNGVVTITP